MSFDLELDKKIISLSLERPVRGLISVKKRCVCGNPIVVATKPVFYVNSKGNEIVEISSSSDIAHSKAKKIIFPTYYYLVLKELIYFVSRLEADGLMKKLNEELSLDKGLQKEYLVAHNSYIKDREQIEKVKEIKDFSAGGMPTYIKCLHSLVGHSLGTKRGVNPIGDKVLDILKEKNIWNEKQCFCRMQYKKHLL